MQSIGREGFFKERPCALQETGGTQLSRSALCCPSYLLLPPRGGSRKGPGACGVRGAGCLPCTPWHWLSSLLGEAWQRRPKWDLGLCFPLGGARLGGQHGDVSGAGYSRWDWPLGLVSGRPFTSMPVALPGARAVFLI